ncbi:family 20 glycosylhydrolase [Gemmatimonadota bacterium]
MKRWVSFCLVSALLVFSSLGAQIVNELRSRGYSLIPAPQQTSLEDKDVTLDCSWAVTSELEEGNIALRRITEGAEKLHGLMFEGSGDSKIVLKIESGTVKKAKVNAGAEQAYRIRISPALIEISGNSAQGLFYGVQSLLQLIRTDPLGRCRLPAGTITDWPTLPLRFIHWDTKHHQSRVETLKRYIDWAAFFKVNVIGFEIEDKYEYPRHPVIGAPGAFTKAQMHELTRYALERYIELVPQIQAPAHMAYVLKHPEFAHLRVAPDCNYQVCLCNEEAMQLIFDIYQDMIDATPGVKYFHASTDEVYYAGFSEQCRKKKPFNDVNRSLLWVNFVNRVHSWLEERGRTMLCWVEYPLMAEHIEKLPRGLINGVGNVNSSDQWHNAIEKAGIKQLIYSSQQGEEHLFPSILPTNFVYRGRQVPGRLFETRHTIKTILERGIEVIGTYAAAWDDSGLHDETFWLGWATVTQYGWSPQGPSVEQTIADFMDVYYGPGNQDMITLYRTLEEGGRFYQEAWDQIPANRLKPSWGSWKRKEHGNVRIDYSLETPQLPFLYDMRLTVEDNFTRKYSGILEQARILNMRLHDAIVALQGKLSTVTRNRYNIEVFLTIARFEKHFCETLLALEKVEKILQRASTNVSAEEEHKALAQLVQAHKVVAGNHADRVAMWDQLITVWGKSRHAKGRSVDGRDFIHILDDVKDHRADRRPGQEYLLEPLENIGLQQWNEELAKFIVTFATTTGLPVPKLKQ